MAPSPANHVLFSNRSVTYASLHQYSSALDDTHKTVELNPSWSKGYSSLRAAYLGLNCSEDVAYEKGLALDPSNEALSSGSSTPDPHRHRARHHLLGPRALGKSHDGFFLKCWNLSDVDLNAFVEAAKELQNMQIEDCHRISVDGVIGSLNACKDRIKTLVLLKCLGLGDTKCSLLQPLPVISSLRYPTIRDCAGLTNSSLVVVVVRRMYQNLVKLDLSRLVRLTDDGILPLVKSHGTGIATAALKGCVNLTDTAISTLVKTHGNTLWKLHLSGRNRLNDKTTFAIADSCWKLVMLDMLCAIVTDDGVALLASARKLNLELLSLEGCAKLTKSLTEDSRTDSGS